MIRVLAAVIRRGDRVLLCKRSSHRRHGGLWEFPGGKLESGETLFDAAHRELSEELGLHAVSVGPTLFVCRDPGSDFVVEFVDVIAEGEPSALEHDDMGWFTRHEAKRIALAPSDARFLAEVL